MAKTFFIIIIILMLSGCMGMMMHGTDHNHNPGETSEKKSTREPREITDTSSDSARAITPETQKPHHEEGPKKKSFFSVGGAGMVIIMVVMMGARFIF